MGALTASQQLILLDVIESVVDRRPMDEALLDDLSVVLSFLQLSKNLPYFVHEFLTLIPIPQWCRLTTHDILTEEAMLELYLMVGFSEYELSRWLHGISFNDVQYFKTIASSKNVLNLAQILQNARHDAYYVDGILVDELPKSFESLTGVVNYALASRISHKQYLNVVSDLQLSAQDILAEAQRLVEDHGALGPIRATSQVMAFRVFCGLFQFLDTKNPYMPGICHVVDQLFQRSSVEKTLLLISEMPVILIDYLIKRAIFQKQDTVIQHLNTALPTFKYGMIRKIVRRNKIKLNYTYD
jgi:hypothetical protein